jgi:hypothetical protein
MLTKKFTDFLKENNQHDTDLIARLSQLILDYRKDSQVASQKCLNFLFEIAETNFNDESKILRNIMVNPPAIMDAAMNLSICQNKHYSPKKISSIFIDTFIATMPEALEDYNAYLKG